MKIVFIMPSVGRKEGEEYLRSWQMEPLPIAQLVGLTPKDIEVEFFDDRMEDIQYLTGADYACISVETYTAKRSYQIAKNFKEKGVKIIMGGVHATLCPEEVSDYADIMILGEAEDVWVEMIKDISSSQPKKIYQSSQRPNLAGHFPDRSIFVGKKYLPISLVETGRGCKFSCNFCSVTAFYKQSYMPRPISDVVADIKVAKRKVVFLVDDNIGADVARFRELLKALIPLKITWFSQISINVLRDEENLRLMQQSGCAGVLVGIESLDKDTLSMMGKDPNRENKDHSLVLAKAKDHGILIYATFVFGYDNDSESTFKETIKFALEQKFFLTAFNHLVPFPGTPLYEKFKAEKRLVSKAWWLEDSYRFGDVAFIPKNFTPEQLAQKCFLARKEFYSWSGIIKRIEFKANCGSPYIATIFFWLNHLFQKEVVGRKGLPLGNKK